MDITQVYNFVNTATQEALGETAVVSEDLQNIVDVGTAIFNANAVDKYVRSLVNHIGRVIFVNRTYGGLGIPELYRDSWEFGSVLEKVQCDLPVASENESWELVNGASYDPNIFVGPSITAKFFNQKITFEVKMSFAELQVKQSFSSRDQLNGFVSMIYTAVENSMTVKIDQLIMRAINNFIGSTVQEEYQGAALASKSTVKAVNLLYLYNQTIATPITDAEALYDPDFIRFASYIINLYANRMTKMSTLFNINGKERFTPADRRVTVLHADFVAAAKAFLYSGTYHDQMVALPENAEVIPYWQGSGNDYDFTDSGKIDVTTADGDAVSVTGVLGCICDKEAILIANLDRRVTTSFNPVGEFYSNWWKFDCGLINDFSEQFVVFFIA